MDKKPAYFEDLHDGYSFNFPSVEVTEELRSAHVALYGEDWPDEVLQEARTRGLIPGPMLMSMLALPMPHPGILVTRAARHFDESGVLVDEPTREMLADYMTGFETWIRRVRLPG